MHQYHGPERFGEHTSGGRGFHHYEDSFHPHIEHGHMRALYEELHTLRGEGAHNGRIHPGEYRAESARMEQTGYLPNLSLDMNPHHMRREGGGHRWGHHGWRQHHQPHMRHHRRGHHVRHGNQSDGPALRGNPGPGGELTPEVDPSGGLAPHRGSVPIDEINGRPNLSSNPQGAWQSSGRNDTVPVHRGRSSDMSVTSGPTITPQKIDEVLQQYHSPAYGRVSGQEVYDKSLQHGINPAVSLAFYVLESSAGTRGKGARNNSWGNIRGGDARDGYKSYDNIHASLDHFLDLISGSGYVGQGRTTLGTILPKYAPRSDGNSPGRYIEDMAGLIRKWQS